MHAAGQFKMLQHRLETILQNVESAGTVELFSQKRKHQVYEEMIECVSVHHKLIWYSESMERLFMYITLGQLLSSAILLCVTGLQVFLVSIYRKEEEGEDLPLFSRFFSGKEGRKRIRYVTQANVK